MMEMKSSHAAGFHLGIACTIAVITEAVPELIAINEARVFVCFTVRNIHTWSLDLFFPTHRAWPVHQEESDVPMFEFH